MDFDDETYDDEYEYNNKYDTRGGPRKPEAIPHVFEKPVQVFPRNRIVNPFNRVHKSWTNRQLPENLFPSAGNDMSAPQYKYQYRQTLAALHSTQKRPSTSFESFSKDKVRSLTKKISNNPNIPGKSPKHSSQGFTKPNHIRDVPRNFFPENMINTNDPKLNEMSYDQLMESIQTGLMIDRKPVTPGSQHFRGGLPSSAPAVMTTYSDNYKQPPSSALGSIAEDHSHYDAGHISRKNSIIPAANNNVIKTFSDDFFDDSKTTNESFSKISLSTLKNEYNGMLSANSNAVNNHNTGTSSTSSMIDSENLTILNDTNNMSTTYLTSLSGEQVVHVIGRLKGEPDSNNVWSTGTSNIPKRVGSGIVKLENKLNVNTNLLYLDGIEQEAVEAAITPGFQLTFTQKPKLSINTTTTIPATIVITDNIITKTAATTGGATTTSKPVNTDQKSFQPYVRHSSKKIPKEKKIRLVPMVKAVPLHIAEVMPIAPQLPHKFGHQQQSTTSLDLMSDESVYSTTSYDNNKSMNSSNLIEENSIHSIITAQGLVEIVNVNETFADRTNERTTLKTEANIVENGFNPMKHTSKYIPWKTDYVEQSLTVSTPKLRGHIRRQKENHFLHTHSTTTSSSKSSVVPTPKSSFLSQSQPLFNPYSDYNKVIQNQSNDNEFLNFNQSYTSIVNKRAVDTQIFRSKNLKLRYRRNPNEVRDEKFFLDPNYQLLIQADRILAEIQKQEDINNNKNNNSNNDGYGDYNEYDEEKIREFDAKAKGIPYIPANEFDEFDQVEVQHHNKDSLINNNDNDNKQIIPLNSITTTHKEFPDMHESNTDIKQPQTQQQKQKQVPNESSSSSSSSLPSILQINTELFYATANLAGSSKSALTDLSNHYYQQQQQQQQQQSISNKRSSLSSQGVNILMKENSLSEKSLTAAAAAGGGGGGGSSSGGGHESSMMSNASTFNRHRMNSKAIKKQLSSTSNKSQRSHLKIGSHFDDSDEEDGSIGGSIESSLQSFSSKHSLLLNSDNAAGVDGVDNIDEFDNDAALISVRRLSASVV